MLFIIVFVELLLEIMNTEDNLLPIYSLQI